MAYSVIVTGLKVMETWSPSSVMVGCGVGTIQQGAYLNRVQLHFLQVNRLPYASYHSNLIPLDRVSHGNVLTGKSPGDTW